MTKRSFVLQKRLQKLETELTFVFSLPPQTSQDHLQISQRIEKQFLFLKNLLSAEIASHPKRPFNLRNITRRLAELQIAFTQWENSNSVALTLDHEDFDLVSACSCSEAFTNDDGEASSPELGEKFYEDLAEEQVNKMNHQLWLDEGLHEEASAEMGWPGFEEERKFFEGSNEEEEVSEKELKREERKASRGKNGVVLPARVVLATALLLSWAVIRLYDSFYNGKHKSWLTPT